MTSLIAWSGLVNTIHCIPLNSQFRSRWETSVRHAMRIGTRMAKSYRCGSLEGCFPDGVLKLLQSACPSCAEAGVCPHCQAIRTVPDTQSLHHSCRTLGCLWERGLRNRDYHVPPCWWVCLDSNGRIPRREGRLPSFLNTREPPHLLSPIPLILTGKCFRSWTLLSRASGQGGLPEGMDKCSWLQSHSRPVWAGVRPGSVTGV